MGDSIEHSSVAPVSPMAASMDRRPLDDDEDDLDNYSSSDEEHFYDCLTSPECEQFNIPYPLTNGFRLLPVFPQILSYFIGQYDGYKTLYNASLVCKALSLHALDALWRELPDLSPIYALLPTSNAKNHWKYNSWNPVFDWVTFHAYGRRVHAFSFTYIPNQRSAEIENSIREIHGKDPLLPNLRSLYITVTRDHCSFELMRFLKFIPPTVAFISIEGVPEPSMSGHDATISLLKMMGMVPAYCTDAFTDLQLSAVFSPGLWHQLFLFRSLKRLSLTVLSSEIPLKSIQRLGFLPILLTLELSFKSSSAYISDCHVHEEVPLCDTDSRNLEVLRLSGPSAAIGAIVCVFVKDPILPLHTLHLTYTQETYPTPEEMTDITNAFPNTHHLKIDVRLDQVNVVLPTHRPLLRRITDSRAITSTTTSPVFASIKADEKLWRRLTFSGAIQSIEFSGVQVLTQECDIIPICEAGSGFYNLHTLHLTCFDKNLTLHIMVVISSNLPHLKTLSLYVNLIQHDEAELQRCIYDSGLHSPHALEHLFLNNTNNMLTANVPACIPIGNFIHKMFPSLKKLGISKPYTLQVDDDAEPAGSLYSATDIKSVNGGWWHAVFKLIQLLQNNLSKTQPVISSA